LVQIERPFDELAYELEKSWDEPTRNLSARAAAYFAAQVQGQLDLGVQIAQIRQQARLSQSELAARSSVPQPEISRIERGSGNPTRETLTKLATALNARLVLMVDDPSLK
jgi:XRE family transcriptional regulator, regulator of sulfur utilization